MDVRRLRRHLPRPAEAVRPLTIDVTQAVYAAAAYGWSDLDLGHGFHDTSQGLRYTISESARREVLGRLLELNHRRYEEEVKAGLHNKKKAKGGKKKKAKAKKSGGQQSVVSGKQASLPGLEDDSPQQLGFFGEEE